MLKFILDSLFGYSITIAAIIGLVRFNKINKSYNPFVYFAVIDTINVTISIITSNIFRTNAVNSNIYILFEGILFLWLFYNFSSAKNKKRLFSILFIALLVVWIIDNFLLHTILTRNSLYRISYSFLIVFLSLDYLNKLINTERKKLLRNAGFLICIGNIAFFTYKAIFEVFYLYRLGIKMSDELFRKLYDILQYANLFANLIYALAMLWIPRKKTFTLPY